MTISAQPIEALEQIVGPQWVRQSSAELETFASDGLPTRHSRPGVVVMPATADEVVRVVRVLAHHEIPFVARGAGTGLSGGALASDNAVLIVLTRLNRILEIDAKNRRAVVEPGVVNVRLSQAAAPYGLHYAPDPSSQTACTIGGNVAENAGGPHCLKYGVTSSHILQLEVVLPSGKIARFGSPNGEPNGPDLVGLFVGSEGMFGIAIRITLRLTPNPNVVRTLLAGFPSVRAAGEAVSAIIGEGVLPAALEMMDRSCVAVVEASIYRAGYPTDAEAVLLVELDGTARDPVVADSERVTDILRAAGAGTVRIADEPSERARLWQGRKKAFGALGRISPDLVVQDAVVPRSTMPDILEKIGEIGRHYGLTISNVFHAGDGNLHPNINFDGSSPEETERVERAAAAIMRVCVEAGGTITGEHGVGVDKLRYMSLIFDADTLGIMRGVRRAFDPTERSNPGKVVPVHRCREWWSSPSARRHDESTPLEPVEAR